MLSNDNLYCDTESWSETRTYNYVMHFTPFVKKVVGYFEKNVALLLFYAAFMIMDDNGVN